MTDTIKTGDYFTIDQPQKRSFWQWLTRKPKPTKRVGYKVAAVYPDYERYLGRSDDWALYRSAFIHAFELLTATDGPATPEDFEQNGGFIRSLSTPYVYFVWVSVGGIRERYYVNVLTRKVFR